MPHTIVRLVEDNKAGHEDSDPVTGPTTDSMSVLRELSSFFATRTKKLVLPSRARETS